MRSKSLTNFTGSINFGILLTIILIFLLSCAKNKTVIENPKENMDVKCVTSVFIPVKYYDLISESVILNENLNKYHLKEKFLTYRSYDASGKIKFLPYGKSNSQANILEIRNAYCKYYPKTVNARVKYSDGTIEIRQVDILIGFGLIAEVKVYTAGTSINIGWDDFTGGSFNFSLNKGDIRVRSFGVDSPGINSPSIGNWSKNAIEEATKYIDSLEHALYNKDSKYTESIIGIKINNQIYDDGIVSISDEERFIANYLNQLNLCNGEMDLIKRKAMFSSLLTDYFSDDWIERRSKKFKSIDDFKSNFHKLYPTYHMMHVTLQDIFHIDMGKDNESKVKALLIFREKHLINPIFLKYQSLTEDKAPDQQYNYDQLKQMVISKLLENFDTSIVDKINKAYLERPYLNRMIGPRFMSEISDVFLNNEFPPQQEGRGQNEGINDYVITEQIEYKVIKVVGGGYKINNIKTLSLSGYIMQ